MAYCLPRAQASKFFDALRAGEVVPEKLMDMTSAERREFFSKLIGENDAAAVNAMFESKMLLKDQKRGMVTWAKQVGGLSKKQRQGFIEKINSLQNVLEPETERAFMEDLAKQKLGIGVSVDEAKEISQGAKRVTELRNNWDQKTQKWTSFIDRMKYGLAYVRYKRYVGDLMRDARKPTTKELFTSPVKLLETGAGAMKGIVASMDNSFYGRQGIKMLFSNPGIWTRNWLKSWVDIGKELIGHNAMDVIEADVFSRPNAMNGKYQNMKLDVGIEFEEAFPNQLPEKIPLFGRLYKASEVAFNGGALRLRADYGDKMIRMAEEFGVDMDHAGGQAEAIGRLVNSMTGRGHLGPLERSADVVNVTMFSGRFLKSNFDTLTMHRFGYGVEEGPARTFVRRQSAANLAKVVGGMASIMFIANTLWPGSVEFDPRSANFGKIKIGNTRFDISGGMGSMVTLAARMVPTLHNGRWGMWSQSSTSGKWTNHWDRKYGVGKTTDILWSFLEGKESPLLGFFRDAANQEFFGGDKWSVSGAVYRSVTPMGAQSAIEAAQDPNGANWLAVLIIDGLGFGANTYSAKRTHQ